MENESKLKELLAQKIRFDEFVDDSISTVEKSIALDADGIKRIVDSLIVAKDGAKKMYDQIELTFDQVGNKHSPTFDTACSSVASFMHQYTQLFEELMKD